MMFFKQWNYVRNEYIAIKEFFHTFVCLECKRKKNIS